jgi:extradiol dioxygenase
LKVVLFHCNPRHHTIAFAQMPGMSRCLHHFMLQLQSLDDVGSTYALCQTQKVPIVMKLGKHTKDHMVSFYLRTPSEFNVEYGWGAREIDDSKWQVQTYSASAVFGDTKVACSWLTFA